MHGLRGPGPQTLEDPCPQAIASRTLVSIDGAVASARIPVRTSFFFPESHRKNSTSTHLADGPAGKRLTSRSPGFLPGGVTTYLPSALSGSESHRAASSPGAAPSSAVHPCWVCCRRRAPRSPRRRKIFHRNRLAGIRDRGRWDLDPGRQSRLLPAGKLTGTSVELRKSPLFRPKVTFSGEASVIDNLEPGERRSPEQAS